MVVSPRSRCGYFIRFGWLVAAALTVGTQTGSAEILDKDSCLRLEAERQSLALLGVEKYVENGADWARTNLKVADLNLVKRYLDVYEQLKFRCKEDIDIAGSDDSEDEEDDEVVSAGSPPLPVRRPEKSVKASIAPNLTIRAKASAPSQ